MIVLRVLEGLVIVVGLWTTARSVRRGDDPNGSTYMHRRKKR